MIIYRGDNRRLLVTNFLVALLIILTVFHAIGTGDLDLFTDHGPLQGIMTNKHESSNKKKIIRDNCLVLKSFITVLYCRKPPTEK